MWRTWLLVVSFSLMSCGGARGEGPGPADSGVDDAARADASPSGDAAVPPTDAGLPEGPNILLLIADDLGIDAFGLYGDSDGDGVPDDGRSYAATPNLDAVCRDGVRFSTAWSAPMCSPTRATILTGRYGFRTGIGTAIGREGGLDVGEPTLPRIMGSHGYRTASLGKWHLGTMGDLGGRSAPQTMGWSYFSGILSGALMDYEDWNRVENGELHPETRYATTANVDDALGWLSSEESDAPWLLWMAFNAPHAPFHRPPDSLHSQSLDGVNLMSTPQPYYRAMIEAMDTEVGRLLAGVTGHNDRETLVIFIGDNGTPGRVIEAPIPPNHSKESLFEGGVHVPFCVRGPGITGGRTSDALVHTVDLFRTILDLAGIEPSDDELRGLPNDSVSFGPVLTSAADGEREFNYTELFGSVRGADGRAVRETRYKLIRYATGDESFFDLQEDPTELTNLLEGEPLSAEESAAIGRLRAALATLEP